MTATNQMTGPAAGWPRPAVLAAGFFAFAVLAFTLAQIDLWGRNGLWNDEYFSIWASDPGQPFFTLLSQRILTDSNPPLYFTALALERMAVSDPRPAFLVLDLIAAALALAFAWRVAVRADLRAAGLCAGALFLLSGAVLCYAPEGRSYFMAVCVAFAVAFAAAATTEKDPGPRPIMTFAGLGVLAALTHVFAALFAGAMGAGLVLDGLLRKRADIVRAGLILGASTVVVFGLWFLTAAHEKTSNIGWIEFTAAAVREAVWFVRQLAFGPNLVALAFFAFVAWTALRRDFWPLLRVFGVGAALFVALPLAASFVIPLIVGRYWLIGAPAIVVLGAFAIRAQLMAAAAAPAGAARRAPMLAAGAGAACFAASSLFGFLNAQAFTESKPFWRGVAIAEPLLPACGAGAVHVWGWPAMFATASGAPADRFVRTDRGAEPPTLDARTAQCGLVGWAEHVLLGDTFIADASDAELLDLLKISGEPGRNVRILRHESGFVVLRADAPQEGP